MRLMPEGFDAVNFLDLLATFLHKIIHDIPGYLPLTRSRPPR